MAHPRLFIITVLTLALLAVSIVAVRATDRTEQQQDAALDRLNCTVYGEDCLTPTAEPTVTPEPTATATATPVPSGGWHAPGSHDGLNMHEHGDAPPAFVTGAFSQTRESHTGYKGVLDCMPNGTCSYLIEHIISTTAARSHGDHDYALWVRDPDTGTVYHWEGVSCFAEPCTGQPPLRTSDTGERPIILSVGDGACETWYSDPGNLVIDVGWVICGRYQDFAGNIDGGIGAFRTMDWVLVCDRLPGNHGLQNNCVTEFGVRRLSFLVNSRDYTVPGLEPIN